MPKHHVSYVRFYGLKITEGRDEAGQSYHDFEVPAVTMPEALIKGLNEANLKDFQKDEVLKMVHDFGIMNYLMSRREK